MSSSYRQLHEEFVSHQNGTTTAEVFAATGLGFLPLLLMPVIASWMANKSLPSFVLRFLLEFIVIVIPVLLSITVFSDHLLKVFVFEVLVICSLIAIHALFISSPKLQKRKSNWISIKIAVKRTLALENTEKELYFVTEYRSCLLLMTALCILAVDFNIFPRRFAKTEVYGYGLMDCGVGSFILANALVAPEARKKQHVGNSNLKKSLVSSIPLIVLGLARFVATSATNYHEHVSEYGRHWNFFFTVGIIKIMASLIFSIVKPQFSILVSVILILGTQHALNYESLNNYLLYSEERLGFVSSNKEGLFSCFGFLAIYFYGIYLGTVLFSSRRNIYQWVKFTFKLFFICGLLWMLEYYSRDAIQPSSRRTANLTYFLWVVAENMTLLGCILLIDISRVFVSNIIFRDAISSSNHKSLIIQAVSYNSLAFFLLANVMTGVVNVIMQTIFASIAKSIIILAIYSLILSLISVMLFAHNIHLKFW